MRRALTIGGPAAVAIIVALLSCLGGRDSLPVGKICTSSDECGDLTCSYGRCRTECVYDRDCSGGACVPLAISDPTIRVCLLPEEACGGDDDCPPGLYCAVDGQCRELCTDSADDICIGGRVCHEGACIEPAVAADAGIEIDAESDGDADGDVDGDIDANGDADGDVDGDVTVPFVACVDNEECPNNLTCCFEDDGARIVVSCERSCRDLVVECDDSSDCEGLACCLSDGIFKCVDDTSLCSDRACSPELGLSCTSYYSCCWATARGDTGYCTNSACAF